MVEHLSSMYETLALKVNTHTGEKGDEEEREEEKEEERERRAILKFQHGPTLSLTPDPIAVS